MVIQGKIKLSDYLAFQYLNMRPRPISKPLVGFLVLFCGWVGLETLMHPRPPELHSNNAESIFIYLGAFVAFYCLIIIPLSARASFKHQKALAYQNTIEVRDAGLFLKSELAEELVPWSHVHKWKYNKRLVAVYMTRMSAKIVPRHFFGGDDQYQAFLVILREKCGKPH